MVAQRGPTVCAFDHLCEDCAISFSRSAERSELLIESEARSAESSEARSAESRSDVAPNARRRAQGDANLGQVFFIYLYIYSREARREAPSVASY